MSKDHDRVARKPPVARTASSSVRKTTRLTSRNGTTWGRETATPHGLVSSTTDRRGKVTQGVAVLAPKLGRIAAQVFRNMRIERFRAALADAQQLVRKYPLQAVLVGMGLGYFLSRTKVR